MLEGQYLISLFIFLVNFIIHTVLAIVNIGCGSCIDAKLAMANFVPMNSISEQKM